MFLVGVRSTAVLSRKSSEVEFIFGETWKKIRENLAEELN
jgi:hypothetical protein